MKNLLDFYFVTVQEEYRFDVRFHVRRVESFDRHDVKAEERDVVDGFIGKQL